MKIINYRSQMGPFPNVAEWNAAEISKSKQARKRNPAKEMHLLTRDQREFKGNIHSAGISEEKEQTLATPLALKLTLLTQLLIWVRQGEQLMAYVL